ncbi:unnamed protein product [Victoria cruziana]
MTSQRPSTSRPKAPFTYYHCNQAGHVWWECPLRRDRAPSVTGSSPPMPQRAPSGATQSRATSAPTEDLQSQDLIQGTLLNEFFVRVLFDTGASHSFVARELARQLGSEAVVAPFALRIFSPLGEKQIDVEYILVEGLYIEDRAFPAQLILLDMTKFYVILGMNWLARHGVLVDYKKHKLIVGPSSQSQRVFKTQASESDITHVGYLRGSDIVCRADLVFVVT